VSASGLTFPVPGVVAMPVTLTVGDVELHLGTVNVELPARQGQGAAALAALLRGVAEVVAGQRHGWPRQHWWVGDSVKLPGSVARGRVVQVDERAKTYLVDVGRTLPVVVRWSQVDPLASREHIDYGALSLIRAALDGTA
jgi:hypothetical protein